MAKKKQGLSPTFKAGIVIILVMGMIWAALSASDPWYQKVEEDKDLISMGDENQPATEEVDQEETEEPSQEAPAAEAPVTTEEPPAAEAPAATEEPTNPLMSETFDKNKDLEGLSGQEYGWSFKRNTDHSPVEGYSQGIDLAKYDAFYRVSTDEKVMYLTFDEGYENGYTATILDTLAANEVQAAFFVTESYIRHNPELVKRMKDEGHIVANHSVNHPSMPTLDYETTVSEIVGVEASMEERTGYKLDMFFRPPMGNFSERSLYITRQQGYKTIFWSMAYVDWDVENQPGRDAAYQHVMDNAHPGAIILLHAVSSSNTEALDDILKDLMAQGYRFGSLYELPTLYIGD